MIALLIFAMACIIGLYIGMRFAQARANKKAQKKNE